MKTLILKIQIAWEIHKIERQIFLAQRAGSAG